MRTSTAFAAICGAVLAAGCVSDLPLQGGPSTIVVSAVLDASFDDQIVVVQRTRNGSPAPYPVDSAVVTITGPDGVAMTGVDGAGTYRVTLSSFHEHLVPGSTYRLSVTLATGEQVTGETTMPTAQPVSAPADTQQFNRPTDTLRLSWPPVDGARSFEVRVQSVAGTYVLFAEPDAVLPGMLRAANGDDVFPFRSFAEATVQVTVAAVDANYYRYYRSNSDEFTGAAVQGNLTGAQGVFGSIVVVGWQSLRVTNTGH